ncbi:MAG: S8 family serine peptidase [candidate division WOR-3 bacterium]|nr:MAG: S8 family serine peptidase [candidate division WOR-3 bacterium]
MGECVFREVVSQTTQGAIVMPEGDSRATLQQLAYCDPALYEFLDTHEVELVITAFPDFVRGDTIWIGDDGEIWGKLTDLSSVYKFRFPQGIDNAALSQEMEAVNCVVYAEPNAGAIYQAPLDDPLDPYFGQQWALDNTSGEDINALAAWEYCRGSNFDNIAIVDNGIDRNHQDLGDRQTGGKVYGDFGYNPDDNPGHGTHCAGIASALTNNGVGIAGVAWHPYLMSQRIDIDNGGIEVAAQAIRDAINHAYPAHIISFSVAYESDYHTILRAFADAYKRSVFNVVAAGNYYLQNNPTLYPAGFGLGFCAVGATDVDGGRWYKSSVGSYVDISAPGEEILSTVLNNGYASYEWSGTSMATPHVAGAGALLRAYQGVWPLGNLSHPDYENILMASSEDKGDPGRDDEFGSGRLDAARTFEILEEPFELAAYEFRKLAPLCPMQKVHDGERRFYDIPGVPDGPILSETWRLTCDVGFGKLYERPPLAVWGRPSSSQGFACANYAEEIGPCVGRRWCDTVMGTVTYQGCRLQTYVYKLTGLPGEPWVPFDPRNVQNMHTIKFKIGVIGIPQPGGCPFLFVQDSSGQHEEDNNVLHPGETAAADYLKLRTQPVAADAQGLLKFEIKETGDDVSWLDAVGLTSYEKPSITNLRCDFLTDGTPVVHDEGVQPATAIKDSVDVKLLIAEEDDSLYVEGDSSDVLLATFYYDPAVYDPDNYWLVSEPKAHTSLAFEYSIDGETWEDLETMHPREHWLPQISLLTSGNGGTGVIYLKVTWLAYHRLDYMCISESHESQPAAYYHQLVVAEHSRLGNVLGILSGEDGNMLDIRPGDVLSLSFEALAPGMSEDREYRFGSVGYVEVSDGGDGGQTLASVRQRLGAIEVRPNPFRGGARIGFELRRAGRVSAMVYDEAGRVVATLVNEPLEAGRHEYDWQPRTEGRVAQGVYFLRVRGDDDTELSSKLVYAH